jgi:hypothetical protein
VLWLQVGDRPDFDDPRQETHTIYRAAVRSGGRRYL